MKRNEILGALLVFSFLMTAIGFTACDKNQESVPTSGAECGQ